MFDVRPIRPMDPHYIMSLDIKVSEIPFDTFDWQVLGNSSEFTVLVATWAEEPIGVIVYDLRDDCIAVHKIAVVPRHVFVHKDAYQSVDIYRALLAMAEADSVIHENYTVRIWVPECSCRGKNDSYDLSAMLNKLGYFATGYDPGMFECYGSDWDAIIFEKQTGDQSEIYTERNDQLP